MPRRDVKKRRHSKVPIGDLRDKVEILARVEIPSGNTPTIEYELIASPWASIETLNPGSNQFNKVAIEDRPTHVFVVRDQLTSEIEGGNLVSFLGYRHRITTHQRMDGRREYIQIFARLLGPTDVEAARS